jgi:hypothetical protein
MFAIFPEILQASQARDLETLACLVRKYFASRQVYAPRFQVEPLFEAMGIRLLREAAPYFARIQVLDHKGQYHVSLTLRRDVEDAWEKNYTLAHLMGYFLLEIQPLMAQGELSAEAYQLDHGALARLVQSSSSAPDKAARKQARAAADGFASALLLPLGMVKKAYQTLPNVTDTAAFFHVSQILIEQRLRALGLIQSERERNLRSRSKAEAAMEAPAAPVIPPEILQQAKRAKLPPPVLKSGDSSSLTRVQKSVASLSYKREDQRPQAEVEEGPGDGLKRLRQLAKKIDKSVDI